MMEKIASSATYGGSAGAVVSGLSSDTVFGLTPNEWSVVGVIGGLLIALLGYVTSVYFQRQHLKVAQSNARESLS